MAMDAFSASLMKDKREIVIAPTIYKFDTFGAFAEEFKLGERDVVLTNEFIYKPFMEELGLKEQVRIPGEVRCRRAFRGYDRDHVRGYSVRFLRPRNRSRRRCYHGPLQAARLQAPDLRT